MSSVWDTIVVTAITTGTTALIGLIAYIAKTRYDMRDVTTRESTPSCRTDGQSP